MVGVKAEGRERRWYKISSGDNRFVLATGAPRSL